MFCVPEVASCCLQLDAGKETIASSVAVVAQLCGVHSARFLWVDDGRACKTLWPMAGLEIQLCLIMTPGAVGQGCDGLRAVLQALTPRLQGHILNEVAARVIVH